MGAREGEESTIPSCLIVEDLSQVPHTAKIELEESNEGDSIKGKKESSFLEEARMYTACY